MPAPLEIILLAAGQSRRMLGSDKRLLTINGTPLLRHSASLYTNAGHHLTVVLGPDDHSAQSTLTGLPHTIAINPNPQTDHSTSARVGLSATPLTARGIVIALADQPLLTPDDISALIASFDQYQATKIIIPFWQSQRGNPIIFPASIAQIIRDNPAITPRRYIDARPDLCIEHLATNPHFTRDVDTPQDAAALLDPISPTNNPHFGVNR
jgi:molybdenum cofactor cytidylyltransferase